MSNHCKDCGCRTDGGICSNREEELFIVTYQVEDITTSLSKEFTDKVEEQSEKVKELKKSGERKITGESF